MARFIILIFLLLLSAHSLACRELVWNTEEWAKKSEGVYLVRVISIAVPDLESAGISEDEYSNEKPDESAIHIRGVKEALLTASMNKQVTIVAHHTLKGELKKRFTIPLKWCGGGQVKLGHVGVLFKLGNDWHIKHGFNNIVAARHALTKRSN